jgi:hypothetical protein
MLQRIGRDWHFSAVPTVPIHVRFWGSSCRREKGPPRPSLTQNGHRKGQARRSGGNAAL